MDEPEKEETTTSEEDEEDEEEERDGPVGSVGKEAHGGGRESA